MTGLTLIVAHLAGDFLLQTDDLAQAKAKRPVPELYPDGEDVSDHLRSRRAKLREEARAENAKGWVACTVHVVMYTWAFMLLTGLSWPWWAYASIALPHWFIDRYRLARVIMSVGHAGFRDGALAPWSVIVFDNSLHLLCVWATAMAVQLA